MKKLMKKRTGFTLVELLIVIIIIGILAGAMLLVAGSGTDKANATKIVSDMRSLKAAALMKWADDGNWKWVDGTTNLADIRNYMDRDPAASTLTSYDVVSEDGKVWVTADSTKLDSGVNTKLSDMLDDSGLVLSDDTYYLQVK
jgi:general secretion pathway protein G